MPPGDVYGEGGTQGSLKVVRLLLANAYTETSPSRHAQRTQFREAPFIACESSLTCASVLFADDLPPDKGM